jgi:hypothetical protein
VARAEEERDAAIARAERAERERDAARTCERIAKEASEVYARRWVDADTKAADTVDAIAAWLDEKAAHFTQNRNLGPYSAELAADIRSGAWRKERGGE